MTEISKMLPGYNCGECGYRQCRDYAKEISKIGDISKCPYLELDRFSRTKADIKDYLSIHMIVENTISEHMASEPLVDENNNDDFPAPLSRLQRGDRLQGQRRPHAGFQSRCISRRAFLPGRSYPFARPADLESGDILRYRPLGCPVIHFAKVIKFNKGIATVHLAGPHQLLDVKDFQYKDMGICMVTGFEGSVNKGRIPDVGETVKFLPSHCRMRQVHSGVIVHSEGNRLRIEGIDLKVWR